MITTFEWKVLQKSDTCQNDPKSKHFLPETATSFRMQRVEKSVLNISFDLSLLKVSLHSCILRISFSQLGGGPVEAQVKLQVEVKVKLQVKILVRVR